MAKTKAKSSTTSNKAVSPKINFLKSDQSVPEKSSLLLGDEIISVYWECNESILGLSPI